MILSRKFVSDYIDLPDIDIKNIAEDMTGIGNEYDYAGKIIRATNLVIGEVKECIPHPDSDHLNVCQVDIGTDTLQIVCGAPNCRQGLKVIVALVGAKLPDGDIKKGKIRGIESNGMLCSLKELGLDNKFLSDADINGICELDNSAKVGEDPIKFLGLDDEIIDFELTSNRGDLLSIIGMAYELGAIYEKEVKNIDTTFNESDNNIKDSFKVEIKTDNCTKFLAKRISNVTIKESPDFIKNRLIACGIRPINNVVDISNYVMLETGQPLHFYDADKLGDTLIVRMASDEEHLITLDSIDRSLTHNDIVIANNNEAIGLAGVMGGLSTEVDNNTKNIIIEAAIFNPTLIRKTSKKILRSEASNRFEKGIDPKRTNLAIQRSCHLLEKYAHATTFKGLIEYDKTNTDDKIISITADKINKVLGVNIEEEEIISIFKRLGFSVSKDKDILIVSVPSRRLDITIKEDLIEEIGRIYGMNKIPSIMPNVPNKEGHYNKTNRIIKNKMISLGLNETLSYALIPNSEVHKYTLDDFCDIRVDKPMSEDRTTLRYSLLYSLVEIYKYNKARNNKDISIFEMGKGFYKENNEYKEDLKLACLMSGDYYLGIHNEKVDFYIIKGILEELLDYLGYNGRYSLVVNNIPNELHPGVSANIIFQGKEIGVIGKIHPNVLKDDVYVFEINLTKLLNNRTSKMIFKEISKYPSIIKDVAFIMDKNVTNESIVKIIKKTGGKLLNNINVFDVYEGINIGINKKSIAYSLTFSDNNKTLSEEEVMKIFNSIIVAVEKTGARVRDK